MQNRDITDSECELELHLWPLLFDLNCHLCLETAYGESMTYLYQLGEHSY